MSNVSAQNIFDHANVRILLTAADDFGRLRFHSIRSSRSAIQEAPGGWKKSPVRKVRDETRQREAWILSAKEVKAVVLPHEWGVELAIGVAAGVGTTAIVELTKWLWRRWQGQESKGTTELPVIRIQVSTSTDKRGQKNPCAQWS